MCERDKEKAERETTREGEREEETEIKRESVRKGRAASRKKLNLTQIYILNQSWNFGENTRQSAA